jgi:hypothetical protein
MATAKTTYYAGTEEVQYPFYKDGQMFAYPLKGAEGPKRVTRIINYKKYPSLHKCDARCLHATGCNCECQCGGVNHGAGGAK